MVVDKYGNCLAFMTYKVIAVIEGEQKNCYCCKKNKSETAIHLINP